MPFNLSFTHMLVVAIVALIVLGPERLPNAARTAGTLYREWRKVSSGLQAEVRDVFSDFTEPFNDALSELRTGQVGEPDKATESPPSVNAGTPLAPALPALGPSTGLVAPGPPLDVTVPSLGPTPRPDTVVMHPGVAPSP
ncbi:MAG: twin-arginine translocase TatA/TatE family subunit [Acidimicrobiales bacterium]